MSDPIAPLNAALTGRYRIDRLLGAGGMGSVYLAHDLRHDRPVAIKVMHPELSASLAAERFLKEITIAARLRHPNIVPLFDSGTVAGFLFYVMPYIEGESLRDRLTREGPLPVAEAVDIACEIADGLHNVHQHDVVHRDLKPGNILLSEGHALLADFGIAKALGQSQADTLTGSGMGIGTATYMSPEQIDGAHRLDGRSDVYSLGCVLFEALAGEPPFTGPTDHAVIVRHLSSSPPSLELARPGVPAHLARAIQKALEKNPHDRFDSALDFANALRNADPPAVPESTSVWTRGRVASVAGLILILTAVLVRAGMGPSPPPLDARRIVVFPLATVGSQAEPSSGLGAALAIGAALEHTAPLKWIDGWTWLADSLRADPGGVTPAQARRVSVARRAGFYVGGVIHQVADSLSVVLRLHAVDGDSLVAQETARGRLESTSPEQLALTAVTRLIPPLLAPGRQVDPSPLSNRSPGAVALLVQGEEEYRASRFEGALEFYRRAIDEDSLLAYAAVKGAQAASWSRRWDEAEDLISLSVRVDTLLPNRYRNFARGLEAFLTGSPNEAIGELRAALAGDPDWSQAHMALAETYYHLIPSESPLDSLAEASFSAAIRLDPTFLPPLHHLLEIRIRAGDLSRAREILDRLTRAGSDREQLKPARWMFQCAENGPNDFDWNTAITEDPEAVLFMARRLAPGARQRRCARRGFEELLAVTDLDPDLLWGAVQGLSGLLIAEARPDDALAVLDASLARGETSTYYLYVFLALAGAPFAERANEVANVASAAAGDLYEAAATELRWLLGAWHARSGESDRAARILEDMEHRSAASGDPAEAFFAAALAPHVFLARGDTVTALERLEALEPMGGPREMWWQFGPPLAAERYMLAELHLARSSYSRAYAVATTFDHQAPITNLAFLRPSLELRVRATEGMGDRRLLERARSRLLDLERADPERIASDASTRQSSDGPVGRTADGTLTRR